MPDVTVLLTVGVMVGMMMWLCWRILAKLEQLVRKLGERSDRMQVQLDAIVRQLQLDITPAVPVHRPEGSVRRARRPSTIPPAWTVKR